MTKFIKVIAAVALAAIGQTLFAYNGGYENSSLTDIIIGNVTYKGYGNNTVTKRTESGTTIAANAYAQCSKLTSVSLTGVTSIGNAAFAYSALTSVELPATLKSIGYIPFGGCKSLASVTINSTAFMTSADEAKEPFRDCTALKTVKAKCAPPTWDFKKVFPNVTTVRVPTANLSAWQAKKYAGVTCVEDGSYKIRFIRNDGAGTLATNEFARGVSVALPTVVKLGFARRGYDFGGWATTTANARNGVAWKKDGAAVKDATAAGKMLDVYAIWKLKSDYYEIRFEKNDGTGKWRALGYEYGKSTALPSYDAGLGWARDGYEFKGWATSAGGKVWKTDKAAVATAAAKGKTLVVYAVWEKQLTYKIRFIRNDGAGTLATETFKRGVSVTLPTVAKLGFARRGYEFGGWATSTANARNGKYWKLDGASVKDAAAADKTLDVYAIWTLKGDYYEIRFEKNDGTGKWRALGYEYGKSTALPSYDVGLGWARAGYTFKGWSTSAAGTVWRTDKAVVATAAAKGKTLTVYAIWTKQAKAVATANASVDVVQTAPGASATAEPAAAFVPGYVRGVFADGSGMFDLLLDGDGTAFFAAQTEDGDWSSECEADLVGDTLVLTFEDGTQLVLRREDGLTVVE